MSKVKLSKRQLVIIAIEAGGATMDSLIEVTGSKYEGVMSIFSMMRLMGKYPVKDVPVLDAEGNETEEFSFRIVTKEENEVIVAERKANSKSAAPKRTPEEIYIAAEKRVERTGKAFENASERAKEKNDKLLNLRAKAAKIANDIATIEFAKAAENFTPEPIEEVAEEASETQE